MIPRGDLGVVGQLRPLTAPSSPFPSILLAATSYSFASPFLAFLDPLRSAPGTWLFDRYTRFPLSL